MNALRIDKRTLEKLFPVESQTNDADKRSFSASGASFTNAIGRGSKPPVNRRRLRSRNDRLRSGQ